MMEADKRDFYAKAAKGLAASARLYNVDAVVHVEDTDASGSGSSVFPNTARDITSSCGQRPMRKALPRPDVRNA